MMSRIGDIEISDTIAVDAQGKNVEQWNVRCLNCQNTTVGVGSLPLPIHTASCLNLGPDAARIQRLEKEVGRLLEEYVEMKSLLVQLSQPPIVRMKIVQGSVTLAS